MPSTLTMKQIRLLHAVLTAKTKAGAANLLGLKQTGVVASLKELENTLGFPLFSTRARPHSLTQEARELFATLDAIVTDTARLEERIERIKRGENLKLRVASVPSIANCIAPSAISAVRGKYPNLQIDFDILKIDAVEGYLSLPRGEAVALSYRFEHPLIHFRKLERATLVCLVPAEHRWARADRRLNPEELSEETLIGVGVDDEYGRILARPLTTAGLPYDPAIRVRFGSSMISLVKHGLGVAIIDSFTVASLPAGVICVPFQTPLHFETYVAHLNNTALSPPCEAFIDGLRASMVSARRALDQ